MERKSIGDMKAGLTRGGRPKMSILPRIGTIYGVRAIEYGADKYARGNYHGPPPAALGANAGAKRLLGYVDAAMRHLTHVSDSINRALGTGGDVAAACATIDDEAAGGFPASNLPHLAHALASLLIGVTCAADDGCLPADPGQPWVASMKPEEGLPQKDDPAAERRRVERRAAGKTDLFSEAGRGVDTAGMTWEGVPPGDPPARPGDAIPDPMKADPQAQRTAYDAARQEFEKAERERVEREATRERPWPGSVPGVDL